MIRVFIWELKSYELERLEPSKLSDDMLFEAYQKLSLHEVWDKACLMLEELSKRKGKKEFAFNQMSDIVNQIQIFGDLDTAKKVLNKIPEKYRELPEKIKFDFDILESLKTLKKIEQYCYDYISNSKEIPSVLFPLVDIAFLLEKKSPALSLVFARAAISNKSEESLDDDVLLELIQSIRAGMNLEIYADPIEQFLEWSEEKKSYDNAEKKKNSRIEELEQTLKNEKQIISDQMTDLKSKEKELTLIEDKVNKYRADSKRKKQRKRVFMPFR